MFTFDVTKDLVSIVAPASACDLASNKLLEAVDLLRLNNFKATYDPNIISIDRRLPFFAASTITRLNSFQRALLDPKVKIIWAFRGGYGCTEIVFDLLDIRPTLPKILIGYSDITALHLLFNQHYQSPTIHGPVMTSLLSHQDKELESIINLLSGKQSQFILESINHIDSDNVISQITGGNLTVFCNMIGTKLHPMTDEKILLLEDISESSYKIHRYLVHLKNSGILNKIKAVIFADFVKSDDNIDQILKAFCEQHIPHIPAYRIFGIGHGDINHPVIFGHNAYIQERQLYIQSPFRLV